MIEDHFSEMITTDPALLAYLVAEGHDPDPATWYYGPGSLGTGPNPAIPERPYIVWNELPSIRFRQVRRTSKAQQRSFTWYVYDFMGDFTRINLIHRHLARIVDDIAPTVLADGTRVSDSEWAGMSENIQSDGYDSSVRFGTGRFVVSQ